MTVNVKESLTKVVNDIAGNRKNLVAQIEQGELQLSINKEQLNNFDVVLASLKAQLNDQTGAAETAILAEMGSPTLTDSVVPPAPLAAAGAGEAASGETAGEGSVGTDANGSPVTSDIASA